MEQQLRLDLVPIREELEGLPFNKAVSFLEAEGWNYCGSGVCAHVLESPDGDRVIKVIRYDAGAKATAYAAVKLPDNPHLPNIGWIVDGDEGALFVESEVLIPVTNDAFREWKTATECAFCKRDYVKDTNLDAMPDGPMKEALAALVEVGLQESPYLVWDTHDANLMIRPGTGEVVLNDTLFDSGERYESDWRGSSYYRCDCGECEECRHNAGEHCGDDACWECNPILFDHLPWSPRPHRDYAIEVIQIVRAQYHAAHRNCGFALCPECQPVELPFDKAAPEPVVVKNWFNIEPNVLPEQWKAAP